MEIKLDKAIPIPEPRGGFGVCHALRSMEVGDSFILPVSKRPSLYTQAKLANVQITVRSLRDGTVRVWRKE